jgi:hypothetical protein
MARHRGKLIALALLIAAVLGIRALITGSGGLPDRPQPIAWDREMCAECRMHIGEPAFAAQLITGDGQVLSFDDPGCLFIYLADNRPQVHRAWVHHVEQDRWLSLDEAGFVRVDPSPMGYRLAAVGAGTPGALSWTEAQAEAVRARARGQVGNHGGPR